MVYLRVWFSCGLDLLQDVPVHNLDNRKVFMRILIPAIFIYHWKRLLGQEDAVEHARSAMHLVLKGPPSQNIVMVSIKFCSKNCVGKSIVKI